MEGSFQDVVLDSFFKELQFRNESLKETTEAANWQPLYTLFPSSEADAPRAAETPVTPAAEANGAAPTNPQEMDAPSKCQKAGCFGRHQP